MAESARLSSPPDPSLVSGEAAYIMEPREGTAHMGTQLGPPEVPPKPENLRDCALSAHRGAGWIRVVGSYRRGVLQIVLEELRRLGFRMAPNDVPDEQISIFWSRSFFPKLPFLKPHQKVNWMPGMNEICRKDFLGKNVTAFAKRFGEEHVSFWPKSFNLPYEWDAFIAAFKADPVPYILKPPMAARGEGIRLFTQLGDAALEDEYIQTKIPLAQQYIPNPLLFHNTYKMSFRFYVALTSVDPLRIYIYQDGLIRICSTPYTTEDFSNLLVHLTNYDLQVENESNFVEQTKDYHSLYHMDGLRASWTELKAVLRRQGKDVDRMWADVQDLVVKSFLSAELPITRAVKTHVRMRGTAYEVTGFDVLLDEQLKPWLLEVNHTPSLCPHTALENETKRHMLRDLYQLVDLEHRHTAATRAQHDTLVSHWKFHKDQNLNSDVPLGAPLGASCGEDPAASATRIPDSDRACSLMDPLVPHHLSSTSTIAGDISGGGLHGEGLNLGARSNGENAPRARRASDSSNASAASSITGSQRSQNLEFPVDECGVLQPDRFVSTDVYCIIDTAMEVRRVIVTNTN